MTWTWRNCRCGAMVEWPTDDRERPLCVPCWDRAADRMRVSSYMPPWERSEVVIEARAILGEHSHYGDGDAVARLQALAGRYGIDVRTVYRYVTKA